MPDLNDVFGYREGRPTHPDMAKLSDIVLQQDGKTEDDDFDYEGHLAQTVDPGTLTYMGMQRALRVAGPDAPIQVHMAMASLFIDGFMIGATWQDRRQEPAISDLLHKYVAKATTAIWDHSTTISADIDKLHDEVEATAAKLGVTWTRPTDD